MAPTSPPSRPQHSATSAVLGPGGSGAASWEPAGATGATTNAAAPTRNTTLLGVALRVARAVMAMFLREWLDWVIKLWP